MRGRTGRVGVAGLMVVMAMIFTGCSGRGGGQLGPSPAGTPAELAYNGTANISFTFTCDPTNADPSRSVSLARLHISLEYQDKGASRFGGPFAIHGEADAFDQFAVNAICSDPFNGALENSEIQFDGVYRVQSGSGPDRYDASACNEEVSFSIVGTVTGCRFTVYVKDNGNGQASEGDFVSIELFGGVDTPEPAPIYSRKGNLTSGNVQVDNP